MSARKIKSLPELCLALRTDRRSGKTIGLANGCFDLLHVGHIRYLEAARSHCDTLVVAINSDRSMRALKGPRRSVVPESERLEIIAALEAVAYVVLFDEPDVRGVLVALRPHKHIKGTDYSIGTVPERDLVEAIGGEVVIAGDQKSHSSTDVVQTIIERYTRAADPVDQ